MNLALTTFTDGISSVKNIFPVYDHLENDLRLPADITSDLLRSQIVYSISALDRFIHEIVRIGIIEIFNGQRISTNKFLNHTFKAGTLMSIMNSLKSGIVPTSTEDIPEFLINREVSEKLGFLAFQAPDKVKDALSYIWNEPHKMAILANRMGLSGATDNDKQQNLEQTLQLIATRRNQIAHEADFDPMTNQRRSITRNMVSDSINFIENLGSCIHSCVTSPDCMII